MGSDYFDWYEAVIGQNLAKCAHKYVGGIHVGPGPKKHMCCDAEMGWCVVAKGDSFKSISTEAELMFQQEAEYRAPERLPGALYYVLKYGTASGHTELHAMTSPHPGTVPYNQWYVHVATALPATDENWSFLLRSNKDLVAINRNGSVSTELYILTAESNYQQFTHFDTGLHPTDSNWVFEMLPNGDLYAATKVGASGSAEVHALSAQSNYTEFTLHIATVLPALNDSDVLSFAFNGDLMVVQNGTNGVQLQLVFAGDQYQTVLVDVTLPLDPTDGPFQYFGGLYNDLVLVKTNNAPTTELHILSAITGYQSFRLHSSTIQGVISDPNQFEFLITNPLMLPPASLLSAFNQTINMKALQNSYELDFLRN